MSERRRPQKVDRQEMVGAVAAVKHWMTMNHEDRLADTEQRTRVILGLVSGIPGLRAEMIENVIGHQPYGLNIWVDKTVAGFDVYELRDKLRDGDPPIWTRVRDEDDYITIHMFGLNPGEDRIRRGKDSRAVPEVEAVSRRPLSPLAHAAPFPP